MPDGQLTFQGAAEEQKIAEMIFGLMSMQGRNFAANAPIRQSLRNLSTFFLERGLRPTQEEATALIESAVKANRHIYYRQETEGEVFYVTSRKGEAVRPLEIKPMRYIPPAAVGPGAPAAPAAHEEAAAPGRRPGPKPTLLKRETPVVVEAKPARREVRREPKAAPVVKRPQVTTAEGVVIYMDRPAEEILETQGAYFQRILAEKLAADSRFVSFGQDWLLLDMQVNFTKSDLRRVRQAIEESGDVLSDTTLLSDLFGKSQEDEDYERARFSLNYALALEKRDFEFRGTNAERLWGIPGMASPRTSRSVLRPSEIGQDLKFLEDEPARTGEGAGRWVHVLTFYEIENGLLPYSPTAKLILPRPLIKEQRVAQLEFRAPQLNLAAIAELHYPSGNRGGWVDGLEEILDSLIPGAYLVVEGTERDNLFLLSYRRSEPVELETVRYDEKKGRFVFTPLIVDHQLDEAMVISKARFKSLANAKRLEENVRRKGDLVIGFAFTKAGVKQADEEDKPVYRASVTDLLPVVNLEKPFSRMSLLRFMTTHPHYQKDETEEGYYFYRPGE